MRTAIGGRFVAVTLLIGGCAGAGDIDSGTSSSGDMSADDSSSRAGEVWASDDETDAPGASLGQLEQPLRSSCGAENTAFNRVVKATVVPSHFPPDSPAAQLAATLIGIPLDVSLGCAAFGIASMSDTCDAHDACYATLGADKDACDSLARSGWRAACTQTYDNFSATDALFGFFTGGLSSSVAAAEQACRTACTGMADAMFEAVSLGGQDAFDDAQIVALKSQPVRLE